MKTSENKGKEQIKAIEEHGKQQIESNALNKRFHPEKDSPEILKQTKCLMNLLIKA